MAVTLACDYYPRVAGSSPQELVDLPRQQQRLLLTACVPLVIAGTLFAGPALRLAYSPSFEVASTFFGLQLVGEVMRLTSFTYAYVLLARAGRGTYLALESAAGALLLVLGVTGLNLFWHNGLGAAYLITYTAYLVAAAELCRRRCAVRPSPGIMCALAITAASGLLLLGDWPPLTKVAVVVIATGASAVLLVRSRPNTRQVIFRTGVS